MENDTIKTEYVDSVENVLSDPVPVACDEQADTGSAEQETDAGPSVPENTDGADAGEPVNEAEDPSSDDGAEAPFETDAEETVTDGIAGDPDPGSNTGDVVPEWAAALPELEEETEQPAAPAASKPKKKKRAWIYALIIFLIAAAVGGYYYYDEMKQSAREELYDAMSLEIGDIQTVEYGDEIDLEELLALPDNAGITGEIDTKKEGEQQIEVVLEEFTRFNESVKKTFPVTLKVEDTKYPEITFTRPIELISLGSEFDPNSNILKVTDPVDGDLEYSETLGPGTYTLISDVDTSRGGVYEVEARAMDLNGNETLGRYRARVFYKRESASDITPPEIWFNEILQEVKFGEEYDLKDNIYSVYDDEDGALEYSEELEDGTYTIKGDIDYETPGDYVVRVRARDTSGNEHSRIFTIRVLEKVTESSAPESSTPASSTPVSSAPASSAPQSSSAPASSAPASSSKPESGTSGKPEEISSGSSAPSEISEISSVSSTPESSESSETPQGGTWVPDPSTNAGYIYNFITNDMGLNRACGLAILAHMRRESGYSPTAYNPDGYYGLCQWGSGRYDNLIAWCGANGYDYTTLEGQLRFMQMELNGTYSGVLATMQGCSNTADGAYDAAYVFGKRYEVSGESLAVSAANTAVEWFNS